MGKMRVGIECAVSIKNASQKPTELFEKVSFTLYFTL
jgi:hypothetical protein